MLNRDRLIVALDVSSATQARQIVQSIGESASTYKVGKQLFTAEGPQIVRDLVASGRKVFLDLKFHDIPNTVAGAVAEAAKLGVSMLTVHASGGSKMLKAAAEAAAQSAYKPMVLAVTVLTSLSDADLAELGISGHVQTQVLRLGSLARAGRMRRPGRLRPRSPRAPPGTGRRLRHRHPGSPPGRNRRRRPGPRPHPQRSHRRRSDLPRRRPPHPRIPRPRPSRRRHRQRDRRGPRSHPPTARHPYANLRVRPRRTVDSSVQV